jgi:hypothetical protein
MIAQALEKRRFPRLSLGISHAKRAHKNCNKKTNIIELSGEQYRSIIIHSSAHDSRRQKKIQKSLSASEEEIKKSHYGILM